MRHPVSTLEWSCGGHALGGPVKREVVRAAVLPAAPQHAHPRARQDADRVGMMAAPSARGGVDRRRPGRGMAGVVGETGERLAEAVVSRPAKGAAAVLAGFTGDRRDGSLRRPLLVGGKKAALIPEISTGLIGGYTAPAPERMLQ